MVSFTATLLSKAAGRAVLLIHTQPCSCPRFSTAASMLPNQACETALEPMLLGQSFLQATLSNAEISAKWGGL